MIASKESITLILHHSVPIPPLQPSTPVSPLCLWHQTHHHRDRTSHHGTARHRATRNPFWACTPAASRPHKPGWASMLKQHRKKSHMKHRGVHVWLAVSPLLSYGCPRLPTTLSFLFSLTHPPLLLSLSLSLYCHLLFTLQGSMSSSKQGSAALAQTAEKRPEDPRTLQQRR